jgi:uncharacterized protein DUF4189
LLLLAAVAVAPKMARAAGALAEGIAPGGAQHGYAVGITVNAPDENTAKELALRKCRNEGNAAAQNRCQVVKTFTDQCATSVEDPKAGTPGIGWAVAGSQQAADAEAITRCKSTAGPQRQAFCTSIFHLCDGTGK